MESRILRDGNVKAARAEIEQALAQDDLSGHLLLRMDLALICALLGDGARALALAQQVAMQSQEADDATRAMAAVRIGHALQVASKGRKAEASAHYMEGLSLAEIIHDPETLAEAYLGLCLLEGHDGNLGIAEEYLAQASSVARRCSWPWLETLARIAMAGAAVALEAPDRAEWLGSAVASAEGSDHPLAAISLRLWQYIHALRTGQPVEGTGQLIAMARAHGLEPMLTTTTLLGPRDAAMLVPVLLAARQDPTHAMHAERLIRRAFPALARDASLETYHPGFTLRVQMLGDFRLWRGNREIRQSDWGRGKARELAQFLLTNRGRWLQREQICHALWPSLSPASAEQQFKVALNALNAVLEPSRPPRVQPFFVRRRGLTYSFAPSSNCWIDVDEFDLRVDTAFMNDTDPEIALHSLIGALELYKGDFLPDTLYASWSEDERERLSARYLQAAVRVGKLLLAEGRSEEVLRLAEAILRHDRRAEDAYVLMMRAHASRGDRHQALLAYERCRLAMRQELDTEPLESTQALIERIIHGNGLSSEHAAGERLLEQDHQDDR